MAGGGKPYRIITKDKTYEYSTYAEMQRAIVNKLIPNVEMEFDFAKDRKSDIDKIKSLISKEYREIEYAPVEEEKKESEEKKVVKLPKKKKKTTEADLIYETAYPEKRKEKKEDKIQIAPRQQPGPGQEVILPTEKQPEYAPPVDTSAPRFNLYGQQIDAPSGEQSYFEEKIDDLNISRLQRDLEKQIDKTVATEIEVVNALESEERNKLESYENRLEELNDKKDSLDSKDKVEIAKIDREITQVDTKKNKLLEPVRKKIELEKRTDAFEQRNQRVRNLIDALDVDFTIDVSVTSAEFLDKMKKHLAAQANDLDRLIKVAKEEGNSEEMAKLTTQLSIVQNEMLQLKDVVNKETGKLEMSKYAKESMDSHGSISLDGKVAFINTEVSTAEENNNFNVAAHEFLHRLLRKTLKKNPAIQLAIGKALHKHIMKIDPKGVQNSEFRKRLIGYNDKHAEVEQLVTQMNQARKNGNEQLWEELNQQRTELESKLAPNQAEEVLTLFSDAVYYGEIAFNETFWTKLGDVFRRIFRSLGVKSKWKNGRDVYNFIRDYNRSIETGRGFRALSKELREGIEIKGELAEDVKKETEAIEKEGKDPEYQSDILMFSKPGSDFNTVLDNEVEASAGVKGFSLLSADEQAKIWKSISEEEKLIIGMQLGPLWRSWVGRQADGRYENNPGWDKYRGEFLDKITTGIQKEDNGLPFLFKTWNPLESKLTTYIINNLPLRMPHTTRTISGFSEITTDTSGAKEVKAPQDIIVTDKVKEQVKTPLLSGFTFTKEQIRALRKAVASIVGTKLPALDTAMSKNKSISPLIAEIKSQLYAENGPIHNVVIDVMSGKMVELTEKYSGKKDPKTKKPYTKKQIESLAFKGAVEAFFRDPKHVKAIIEAMPTTWLAKHLPMAVQKKVVGVGWTTNFKGKKKGTKRGDIDFWKSSEEGPYKGMTDGKQKIRRNPNATKEITPAMLLSAFVKGDTISDIKRKGLNNISLAVTQELGLEVFKADMLNSGSLKDLFVGRQELFNRVLDSNFVEEYVRQADRGVTMFSLKSKITTSIMSAADVELKKRIDKQANYNDIVELAEQQPIDVTTEDGRIKYLEFFTEVVVPLFPKEVLLETSGTFARGDRIYDKETGEFVPELLENAYKAKYIWPNKEQFEYYLDQLESQGIRFGLKKNPKTGNYINLTKKDKTDMLNAVKRVHYGKNTKKDQQKKVNDNALKESKKRGSKLIWEIIQREVQADANTIPGFAVMLSSSSQFQGHLMRTGAGVNFYNLLIGPNKEVNREEHTSPITAVGKYLFINAIAGNLFTGKVTTYDNIMKSYFQGALPLFMDSRLKQKGPDGKMLYNYSDMPPLEHLAGIFNGDISIWARYFHPNVNSNFDISPEDAAQMSEKDFKKYIKIGGIDPNVIILAGGQTLAKSFGVNVDVELTPQIIAAQQGLIYRISIGEKISKKKINNILKAATNIKISPNLESNLIMSKAILKSRTAYSKPSKGASIWDFDDTLAITKSGVRYTIPNTNGLPQPSRKVIFMAGSAGSGKSNVINKLNLKEQGFKVVNQDISLEWLKKNNGLPENMNDLTKEQRSTLGKLGHQARGIAKRKMMKYQGNAEGIVVDGTGASSKVMEKMVQEFKNKGYDVGMLFVETSLDVALERNSAREERSLLDKMVIRNHESVQGNKNTFKKMFGETFIEINTDNLKQESPMPKGVVKEMDNFTKGYVKGRLTAEEFASMGEDLLTEGAEFDFVEFNVVTEGETGPLFGKALERVKKFGTKDQFILTARPAASAPHIQQFLQTQGLNIPLENIIGLGNSTSEAKALWIAGKVGEGYNDIYFADDALANVQAVKNMLDQLDIKSDVQQAKLQFSKTMNTEFNSILDANSLVNEREANSINNVKGVNTLGSENVYRSIQFSKKHRAEYENIISKHRPDLVKEGKVSQTIDAMFVFVDDLNITVDKKRKYERITTKWLATSNIKLIEDRFKITDAVNLAERYKLDLFSYNNPNEIIEAYAGKVKDKVLNPNKVNEFGPSKTTNKKHGITEHEVENTKEGQQAVRDIVDSHWGKNSNPWCLTQAKEGKLTADAWTNWRGYEDGPKRIVFQNGKLLAFYASNQYWDRMDNDTDYAVVQIKKGRVTNKVELVPEGEFVMETRTVSKDGNTVTTEYFAETKNYNAGTTVVENRVNGVTIKESVITEGDLTSVTEFKNGKAVVQYEFGADGKATGVNNYSGVFGDMISSDIVTKKGDMIEFQYREDGYAYMFASINLDAQGISRDSSTYNISEIGWRVPVKNSDLKNFIQTVNGNVRIDLKKVLEIDSNVKGLPKKAAGDKSGIQFSKRGSKKFNEIIEQATGVEVEKKFSGAQAKIKGSKRKIRGLVPPSAQDFLGLLYNFLPQGEKGEQALEFFKKSLIDPFARGINELNTARQNSAVDYKKLLTEYSDVRKTLLDNIGDTGFTNDQAVRVYLWSKSGFEVPGLSKRDLALLTKHVESNAELQAFADNLGLISKGEQGYSKPGEYWLVENISSDLLSDGAIGDARAEFLAEWQENVDVIFSKENMNKIQAIYGSKFREALEDILYRMRTGKNRPQGGGRLSNIYTNWVNNSVGAIMFFNVRSAVLQTISATNYVNWSDNNPLKVGAAFANQKQFWKDFVYIFNSDYLKQRRSGNRRGVNEAELSAAIYGSEQPMKAALNYLLKIGFLPTQIADSFAIAFGGAAFYRNRVKTNLKKGMSQKEAEDFAWLDFQEKTEVSQQSARPDLISQQQANPLGRLILSFQNTPMQYGRIMNKALRDIANNRGDLKTNVSKIIYYGALQGILFTALQSAIWSAIDDDEELNKKEERMLSNMIDSWLSTFGYGGKAVSATKNTIIEYFKQREKDLDDDFMSESDHAYTILQFLSFSPPIGSKVRKIYQSTQSEKFNRDIITERGWSIDNPVWSAVGNVIEGVTNIPLGRLSNKLSNLENAIDSRHETWQRVALLMGWNKWDIGIEDPDIVALGEDIKERKKQEKKMNAEKKKIKKEEEKLKEKYPNKTEKEIKETVSVEKKIKQVYDLSKREQVKILNDLKLNPKNYPKEKDRVDKIMEFYNKDPDKINSTLNAIKNYVPNKSEQRSINLFKLTKKDQVNTLMKLGLSSKRIKELKYEEDRVNMIIKLENKKKSK
tara:strand:- start:1202 stop:10624 length:9423 start_codon:yes stop_codon:yes gene_type:complete